MPPNHVQPARTSWSARQASLDGATLGLWIGSALLAISTVVFYVQRGWLGGDTHAYWHAARTAHPYGISPGGFDAFEYSPVVAQILKPLGVLPFGVAYALWVAVEAGIFVVLTRGVPWRWRGVALLLCVPELALGNLHGFFSLVLVGAVRWPESWSLALLTKITPFGVGMLWHLRRRELGHIARALAFSAAIVAISVLAQPHLWQEWFHYLEHNSSGQTAAIMVRCGVAALLAVAAGRPGRAWLLPAAAIISEPVFGGLNKDLAMLPVTLYLARSGR